MPKVSDEYLEARRTEILDGAEAVIARRGVHGATLSHIRAEAGVSSGALYHYFKSKDDIVAGIRERALAADEAVYHEAKTSIVAKEALTELVELGMALNHGSANNIDARLAVILWAEALINPYFFKSQMRLMDPWWETAAELAARAVEEGDLSSDVDAEALAAVLAALGLGATLLEAWEPNRINTDRLIQATRALLLGELWQPPEDQDT